MYAKNASIQKAIRLKLNQKSLLDYVIAAGSLLYFIHLLALFLPENQLASDYIGRKDHWTKL